MNASVPRHFQSRLVQVSSETSNDGRGDLFTEHIWATPQSRSARCGVCLMSVPRPNRVGGCECRPSADDECVHGSAHRVALLLRRAHTILLACVYFAGCNSCKRDGPKLAQPFTASFFTLLARAQPPSLLKNSRRQRICVYSSACPLRARNFSPSLPPARPSLSFQKLPWQMRRGR